MSVKSEDSFVENECFSSDFEFSEDEMLDKKIVKLGFSKTSEKSYVINHRQHQGDNTTLNLFTLKEKRKIEADETNLKKLIRVCSAGNSEFVSNVCVENTMNVTESQRAVEALSGILTANLFTVANCVETDKENVYNPTNEHKENSMETNFNFEPLEICDKDSVNIPKIVPMFKGKKAKKAVTVWKKNDMNTDVELKTSVLNDNFKNIELATPTKNDSSKSFENNSLIAYSYENETSEDINVALQTDKKDECSLLPMGLILSSIDILNNEENETHCNLNREIIFKINEGAQNVTQNIETDVKTIEFIENVKKPSFKVRVRKTDTVKRNTKKAVGEKTVIDNGKKKDEKKKRRSKPKAVGEKTLIKDGKKKDNIKKQRCKLAPAPTSISNVERYNLKSELSPFKQKLKMQVVEEHLTLMFSNCMDFVKFLNNLMNDDAKLGEAITFHTIQKYKFPDKKFLRLLKCQPSKRLFRAGIFSVINNETYNYYSEMFDLDYEYLYGSKNIPMNLTIPKILDTRQFKYRQDPYNVRYVMEHLYKVNIVESKSKIRNLNTYKLKVKYILSEYQEVNSNLLKLIKFNRLDNNLYIGFQDSVKYYGEENAFDDYKKYCYYITSFSGTEHESEDCKCFDELTFFALKTDGCDKMDIPINHESIRKIETIIKEKRFFVAFRLPPIDSSYINWSTYLKDIRYLHNGKELRKLDNTKEKKLGKQIEDLSCNKLFKLKEKKVIPEIFQLKTNGNGSATKISHFLTGRTLRKGRPARQSRLLAKVLIKSITEDADADSEFEDWGESSDDAIDDLKSSDFESESDASLSSHSEKVNTTFDEDWDESGGEERRSYVDVEKKVVSVLERDRFGEESEGGTAKENILIARLPDARYVGIKLFQGRPATFKSESARLNWDNSMAKNAIKLKIQLESSQITPQSVQNQLEMDLNLSEEEKSNLDKEWEVEEKKSRIQFFQIEMKLSDLNSKIRSCLGWEKADTEQCIKLLDELVELEIQPLMLLKNAPLVETIKRMRQYVGNPTAWKLDEEEALNFSKQTHLIRKKSEHCYNMFKILFTVPEGLSFWEAFTEQVMQFKECTEHLSSDELCEIVTEPPGMKSEPRAFTMQSAIDAAIKDGALSSEEESSKKDKKKDTKEKIKSSAKRSKLSTSTDGGKKESLKRTLSKASTGSKPEEASPDASNGALNGEGEPVESSEVKEKSDAKKAKIVTKKTEAASVKSPSKRKSK